MALLRRAGWGVGDQVLSSLTNFALGVMVARATIPREFGAFSIAFATYLIMMGATRALTAEPFMVRFSTATPELRNDGARATTGAALCVGLIGGVACLVVGLAVDGALRQALLGLALVAPGLMLQDAWRYVFFGSERPSAAFANDLVWAVVMFPTVGIAAARGFSTILVPVVIWGGAATVAAAFGVVQARIVPRPDRAVAWLREQRDLASRYLGEFSVMIGVGQGVIYAVGAIAGLQAAGAIRAGHLLLGPPRMLVMGIQPVAVPAAARMVRSSVRDLRKMCIALSGTLAAIALTWGTAASLIPADTGSALLGDNWAPARRVLMPMAIIAATSGVITGALVGLRALGAAKLSLRARITSSLSSAIGGVVGALFGGARPAAWGIAIGFSIGAAVWWVQLISGLSRAAGGLQIQDGSPSGPEIYSRSPDG